MAIHMAFMMPTAMIVNSTPVNAYANPSTTFSVQLMKLISSSQLVTSRRWPVQSSPFCELIFSQKGFPSRYNTS
jgi:hypothetical protein